MEQHFMAAILAVGIAAGWAVAQQESAERHVPEITAESKAKYPQGVADSVLCQRAREQHPPYSRFRWHEPDLAKMEKDLEALMRESDEVVMVGTPQRWVTALSPSGEDAISYADVRVLYSWKGSHKVGDVITFGSPQGSVTCGPGHNEFSGTTVGPSPQVLYHTPNPAYSPAGPYVLFPRRPGENSQIEAFRLAGGNGVQGFFNLVPGQIISERRSPYVSCFLASYDHIACHSYPQGWSPEWCRDPKVDAQNIAQCNAAVSAGKEPIFANGVDQDPLREKYHDKPIGNFLRAVHALQMSRHTETRPKRQILEDGIAPGQPVMLEHHNCRNQAIAFTTGVTPFRVPRIDSSRANRGSSSSRTASIGRAPSSFDELKARRGYLPISVSWSATHFHLPFSLTQVSVKRPW